MFLLPQRIAHLFLLDFRTIEDSKLGDYKKPLSEEELKRVEAFSSPELRRKQLITRMAVRSCLSRYSDSVKPQDWAFEFGPHGKPQLTQDAPINLSFNVSHSGDWLVVAITVDTDIGADIQRREHHKPVADLAGRFFHEDETRELVELEAKRQTEQFFRLWTLKEAYLKARGLGIANGLDKVRFHIDNNGLITGKFDTALEDDAGKWQFHHYELEEDYCLSLAMKQPRAQDASPHFYKIIPGQLIEPLDLLAHEIQVR